MLSQVTLASPGQHAVSNFSACSVLLKSKYFAVYRPAVHSEVICGHKKMVELSGIEPLTSCVQGRRSPS
jgi:hypothetical protein